MLIIHGEKFAFRNTGRVAEFCVFCREVRACRVVRIGITSHVYYLSFSKGRLVGHKLRCESCRGWWMVDLAHYPGISEDRTADLAQLIAQTHPQVETCCAPRLELERRVRRRQPLTTEIRNAMLEVPFRLLNLDFEQSGHATRFDRWTTGALILAAASMVVGTLVMWLAVGDGNREFLGAKFVGASSVAFVLFLGALATGLRRYIRRHTIPPLGRALKPLEPTSSEIAEVLTRLRVQGLTIGSKLRPAAVVKAIGSRPGPFGEMR
jgi:hypothetical protein